LPVPSERPRNVTIRGKRTSMRLEPGFWDAIDEIATREGLAVDQVFERVAKSPHRGNLSSAIRVYVLAYFRGPRARPAARTRLQRRTTWNSA
jgi:predicted DNA-binding ribbon-helix-helix protein